MKYVAEILNSISALLWPIFAFSAIFLFRKDISSAIARIKKGTFLGQEVELSDSLNRLHESANILSEEVSEIPSKQQPTTVAENDTVNREEETIKSIIQEAARSPKAALLLLAAEIERETRHTMACLGLLDGRKNISLMQAISELDSHYGFPRHVPSSLKLFWETRNKLIHGGTADDGNILSAIDSGVSILKSLYSLPREANWIHNPGIAIYSDPECKNIFETGKGVILKSSSPSGAKTFYRIFPTTKTDYIKGKRVSWEWSFSNSWNSAWYKDPDSGEVKQAWMSSAEFVGRHLDDI